MGQKAPPSGRTLPLPPRPKDTHNEACYIDAKECHVFWMSTHCQKRQYMTPWDENELTVRHSSQFLIH